jgi:hypothetical protein
MTNYNWELNTRLLPDLPCLAWIAYAPLSGGTIKVQHGKFVELFEDSIVEGCWDGAFSENNFHNCENLFGSGIKITEDGVFFCSSLAMVDRLIYARYRDQLIVSNSLVVLLASTNAALDPKHDYYNECYGSLKGILKYQKEFRVLHPEIENFVQVYSSNLALSKGGIKQSPRSLPRHIENFDHYYALLRLSLKKIRENARSDSRRFPLRFYSTLSSGYDSTAVTCLASDIDVTTCFTTKPGMSRKSRQMEDGIKIADILQMDYVLLDPEDSSVSANEAWFLAPTYEGCEVIFDRMVTYIEKSNEPSIVLTGYHGDKVWDRRLKGEYLSDEIVRGDTSGLNLSEVRLKSGFINVAVPFIFSRSVFDIVKSANSQSMSEWHINNEYDRPIPRRIAESHGIPRQFFGQKKKTVLTYYSKPINKQLGRKFEDYLRRNLGIGYLYLKLYETTEAFDYAFVSILKVLMPQKEFKEAPWSLRRFIFRRNLNLRVQMFIWACTYLASQLRQNGVGADD